MKLTYTMVKGRFHTKVITSWSISKSTKHAKQIYAVVVKIVYLGGVTRKKHKGFCDVGNGLSFLM